MVPNLKDETYGDVKTPGYRVTYRDASSLYPVGL
jgi:hypothetical protein